jgi:hypothetical protein
VSVREVLAYCGDPRRYLGRVGDSDELKFVRKGFAGECDGCEECSDELTAEIQFEQVGLREFVVQKRESWRGEQKEVGLVEVSEAEWAADLREAWDVVGEGGPEIQGAELESGAEGEQSGSERECGEEAEGVCLFAAERLGSGPGKQGGSGSKGGGGAGEEAEPAGVDWEEGFSNELGKLEDCSGR